jgi:hypothetical protein
VWISNQHVACVPFSSTTYQPTGRTVAVRYTQGNWEGGLGIDRVSIPKGPNQTIVINIAAISASEGFYLPGVNWQGILGMAYPLLARVSRVCEGRKCHFEKSSRHPVGLFPETVFTGEP